MQAAPGTINAQPQLYNPNKWGVNPFRTPLLMRVRNITQEAPAEANTPCYLSLINLKGAATIAMVGVIARDIGNAPPSRKNTPQDSALVKSHRPRDLSAGIVESSSQQSSWVHPFAYKRFHVLLNSLFKVLCNFPSRYLFAIGFAIIFSLRRSLPPTLGYTLK